MPWLQHGRCGAFWLVGGIIQCVAIVTQFGIMMAWIFDMIMFCSCQWDCLGVFCVLTASSSSWVQGWVCWSDFHSHGVYTSEKFGKCVFRCLFPKQWKRVWTRWPLQSLLVLKPWWYKNCWELEGWVSAAAFVLAYFVLPVWISKWVAKTIFERWIIVD